MVGNSASIIALRSKRVPIVSAQRARDKNKEVDDNDHLGACLSTSWYLRTRLQFVKHLKLELVFNGET